MVWYKGVCNDCIFASQFSPKYKTLFCFVEIDRVNNVCECDDVRKKKVD